LPTVHILKKINNKLVLKIALNKKDEPGFPAYGNSSSEFDFPFKLANE